MSSDFFVTPIEGLLLDPALLFDTLFRLLSCQLRFSACRSEYHKFSLADTRSSIVPHGLSYRTYGARPRHSGLPSCRHRKTSRPTPENLLSSFPTLRTSRSRCVSGLLMSVAFSAYSTSSCACPNTMVLPMPLGFGRMTCPPLLLCTCATAHGSKGEDDGGDASVHP